MNFRTCSVLGFAMIAVLSFCLIALPAPSYNLAQLQADFVKVATLGKRIETSMQTASKTLSLIYTPGGQVAKSAKLADLTAAQQKLANDVLMPGKKTPPSVPNARGIVDSSAKLDPNARIDAQRPGQPSLAPKQPNPLVSSLPPSPKAGGSSLEQDSTELRIACLSMIRGLSTAGSDGTTLRRAFSGMLDAPANKSVRWYFTGVVGIIAGDPDLAGDAALPALIALQPALRAESRTATAAIDWGFSKIFGTVQNAQIDLSKFARTDKGREAVLKGPDSGNLPTARMLASAGKPSSSGGKPPVAETKPPATGSKPQPKPPSSPKHQWISDMYEDMANNVERDFKDGCKFGQSAGKLIGATNGLGEAWKSAGRLLEEKSTHVLVDEAMKFGHEQTKNKIGIPDPYEIVGQYAGGAIGLIGGAIGTAAGWAYGTWESKTATLHNNPKPSATSGTTGKPGPSKAAAATPNPAAEDVPLF
jgi:hypothetical protein